MFELKPTILKRLLMFTAPVVLGALALFLMQRARTEPKRRPPEEQGRAVRVLQVAAHEASPRAVGYGVVQSERRWELVAEVPGRIIEINEDLETGRIIRKGTPLLKIDPGDYKIATTQQKASVDSAKAQLSELAAREKSTKASLKIAERSLALSRKEFNRVTKLQSEGAASASEVDEAERQVLTQQTAVQNLRSTLAEMPANRRSLKAQIDQSRAGVKGAELDISRTEIAAPFDVRIRSVSAELSELVSVGATLAEGDGIAVAEVPAQFPIGALQPLFPPAPQRQEEGAVSTRALSRLRTEGLLEATVKLESGEIHAEWEAKFDRFGNVDSQTRTVAVIVSVDKPWAQAQPGVRPPLVVGMYVEVELRGKPRPGCLAVPRVALRPDKSVFIVGDESRLEQRKVEVDFVQDEYACIHSGIAEGDEVVLTELTPAIDGTLLVPKLDDAAAENLRAAVTGEAAQR